MLVEPAPWVILILGLRLLALHPIDGRLSPLRAKRELVSLQYIQTPLVAFR